MHPDAVLLLSFSSCGAYDAQASCFGMPACFFVSSYLITWALEAVKTIEVLCNALCKALRPLQSFIMSHFASLRSKGQTLQRLHLPADAASQKCPMSTASLKCRWLCMAIQDLDQILNPKHQLHPPDCCLH